MKGEKRMELIINNDLEAIALLGFVKKVTFDDVFNVTDGKTY